MDEVTVAGSGEKWRWADPQGAQRLVHADELRAALSSGALPPYTLVWREGMPQWQPAYLVTDLTSTSAPQSGIPNVPPPPMHIVAVQEEFERQGSGAKEEKPKPKKELEPPPPPVHQYAAIMAAVPPHLMKASEASRAAAPPHAQPASPRAPSPHPPVVAPAKAAVPFPAPPKAAAPASVSAPVLPVPPVLAVPPHAAAPPGGPLPSPPGARASAAPPPPPRQHRPAPVGHAPPAGLTPMAPPVYSRAPPVPAGAFPPKSLLGIAGPSPAVVPAPQAFPPSAIAQSPLFAGNGEASPVPPAPAMPQAVGMPHVPPAPPSRPSDDLPAFPLDEIEIDEDEDQSPASRSARRGLFAPQGLGSKIVERLRGAQQTLRPFVLRAKQGALRAKEGLVTKAGPAVVDGFAYIKANPKDPKVMAGLGGVALLVLIGLGALALSAGSKKHTVEDEPAPTTSSSAAPPTAAAEPAVAAPATAPAGAAVACRLTKEAARIAAKASKDVPIELAVSPGGERARVGFSTDSSAAQGLSVDLTSFKMTPEFGGRAYKVRAVIPMVTQGKTIFVINADGKRDRLQAWRALSIDPPIFVGWADNAVSVASKPAEAPRALWTLDGDALPDTLRSADVGEQGLAVVFRRRGGIFGGFVGKDRSARGGLTQIAGAGAPDGSPVGSPTVAVSGSTIAVAFADRASASEPWSLRIGAASLGSFPAQTAQFAVPPGGPGGAAIAPALAGLGDGRFLLAWTEGGGGDHDVRAQTLSFDLKPVGAPFSVSHSGGNAGQGAVAVSAGRGLVAYLALTDHGYEVWGAGVDCR